MSLIIPAYNEGGRIEAVLSNYANYFPEQEIIVVCNGCIDNTPDIVTRLCSRYPQIRLLNFEAKLGKGGAIIEGFKMAERDIIGFVDADESVGPEDIANMLAGLSDSDGIIASRKLKASRIMVKQPLKRRIASRAFNVLVRLLFGLNFKDTQCGAKVFRKKAIKDVLPELKTRGFEFDVELLWRLRKRGYQVKEFPVTWKHSEGSTFSLTNAPGMFLSLLKVRLRPYQNR